MKSKYWNKYTKKTMVKQAKIYEIDLGQNVNFCNKFIFKMFNIINV